MEQPYEIQWRKFTAKSMPPYRQNVLIWRGLADSDGGFPLIGKLYHDKVSDEDYISYKPDCNGNGDVILQMEFRQLLWAEIPWPERARKKWQKEQETFAKWREQKRAKLDAKRGG